MMHSSFRFNSVMHASHSAPRFELKIVILTEGPMTGHPVHASFCGTGTQVL
jgi:hypothetical protein